jgi:hypothetical protein
MSGKVYIMDPGSRLYTGDYITTGADVVSPVSGLGCGGNCGCTGCSPKPTGDFFEFRLSSIIPWLIVGAGAWILLKSPETRTHAFSTARSEAGRAYSSGRTALAKYRTKKRYTSKRR